MTIHKQKGLLYATSQADLPEVLREFAGRSYLPTHFRDAECQCGFRSFRLAVDEAEGVAIRTCRRCHGAHLIGDSDEYANAANPLPCECLCDAAAFEITVGVSLYSGTEDVRWLYIGCRCTDCDLAGCYGDWKNEFSGFRELLARI